MLYISGPSQNIAWSTRTRLNLPNFILTGKNRGSLKSLSAEDDWRFPKCGWTTLIERIVFVMIFHELLLGFTFTVFAPGGCINFEEPALRPAVLYFLCRWEHFSAQGRHIILLFQHWAVLLSNITTIDALAGICLQVWVHSEVTCLSSQQLRTQH